MLPHGAPSDVGAYVGNIVAAASDARLRLSVKGFREYTGRSEIDERAEIEEKIGLAFDPPFGLISVAKTNLGGIAPDGSQHDRPGLVLRLMWRANN